MRTVCKVVTLVLLAALLAAGCQHPMPPRTEAPEPERLVFHRVRQYVLNTSRAGKLLVVEGMAESRFADPLPRIELECVLLDKAGRAVREQRFVPGNTLTPKELLKMSVLEIEAVLNDARGIEARNAQVERGESVPFTTVFYDPPGNVAEYEVRHLLAEPAAQPQ